MGPRFFNRGKWPCIRMSAVKTSLQWGRGFSTAESLPVGLWLVEDGWLQWGRGFSTAERAMTKQKTRLSLGFNGAAVFQPRKALMTSLLCRKKHCFNGAAVFQPRKAGNSQPGRRRIAAASMGPRFFNRGKRKRNWLGPKREKASMGPRFFNRGKIRTRVGPTLKRCASMGPRFFNRGKTGTLKFLQGLPRGFNGAAVFQPRKAKSQSKTRPD